MKRQILLILVPGALGLLLTGLLLWGLSPDIARTQAAAPAAPQQILIWEEDFSQALPPDTYYITATTGSGLVDNLSFLLTQDAPTQGGRIFYLTPTLMTEFSATFRLYLGSKDSAGADGAAFIFCPTYDYPQVFGGMLDASCPEGYFVAFDTYEDGGIGPDRVYLAYEIESNRLESVDVSNLEDNSWHDAGVIFDHGTLTVTLDGSDIIAGFSILGYEPLYGYFGFSAATGGLNNEQRVDDIQVQAEYIVGYLDGHVYDTETLAPIEGTAVTGERLGGGSWSADTDPSGYYSMTVATGTYTVTAEHPSYLTDSTTGMEVLTDAVTTLDFYLTPKVAFDPSPLHVTLDWQATHAMSATLINRQAWDYDFEFFEQTGGFVPLVQGAEMDSTAASWPESDAGICVGALCEEIYGSPLGNNFGGTWDRGNIFEATEDTVIQEIRAWLDFAAPTDMYFIVYEGTGLTGSFTKIFERQVNVGTGAQWHSSGPIHLPAEAGKFYYVGASWNGTATHWWGNEPVPITTDCFGILHTGVPSPLAGYPPAPTMNNTWTGVSPYHFAIVTGKDVIPWFGQEPLTGTVPASTTVPGELAASMFFTATYEAGVDQPGDYYATLRVAGDPSLQVPVTMTVLPPGDMGKLVGSVTDNCTAEPIEDVHISIADGDPITQTWTDAEGGYSAWLFEDSYELVFSTTGYLPFTDTVDILAGQTTTLDVSLVPEHACIDVYPEEYEVWVLTGTLVYTHNDGLDIRNDGGQNLEFEILDIEGGYMTPMLSTATPLPEAAANTDDPASFAVIQTGSRILGNPVLIVQDQNPWGYDSIQQILTANGIAFDMATSLDIPSLDLNPYELVIIPSNQPGSFYTTFNSHLAKFESYVNSGGKMWMSTCAFSGTTPEPLVPGGVVNATDLDYYNILLLPSHPWVQGVPNPFYGSSASHDSLSNLPPGTLAIAAAQTSGIPTLIEYDLGAGHMAVTGQTLEFAWWNGWEGAPILENSLLDMVSIVTGLDSPWIWEEPISGTVPALSTTNADILFSAVVTDPLPLGTYTATLMVRNNDPVAPTPLLPVSMHVVEEFSDPVSAFESNAPLCLGETSEFNNTSLEGLPPTAYYLWDFGDGMTMTTTTTETVTHTYAAAGIYPVTLTAHQVQTGVEVVYTDSVEVRPLPAADFSYTANGLLVDFTNASANATSYQWDFGDGYSSTLENPSHTYASFGDYPVSLTVYGTCGLDQVEKTITVGFYHNYLPLVSRE